MIHFEIESDEDLDWIISGTGGVIQIEDVYGEVTHNLTPAECEELIDCLQKAASQATERK